MNKFNLQKRKGFLKIEVAEIRTAKQVKVLGNKRCSVCWV